MSLTLGDYHQILVSELKLLTDEIWTSYVAKFGGELKAATDCDAFLCSLERHAEHCDGHPLSLLTKFQRGRVCDVTDRGQSLLIGGGKYLLVDPLGDGGQAEVYLARCRIPSQRADRLVAIKRVSFNGLTKVARERWSRECRLLCDSTKRTLPNSQYVVAGVEVISDSAGSNLVMEWVRGRTLQKLCDDVQQRVARLSVRHCLLLTDSILKGLAFLHGLGCVHRDLKPANLILAEMPNDRYFVCIVDLGLVKIVDESLTDPLRGGMGTLYYSAPECCARAASTKTPADLYGLAAVLCKLLCGEPPAYELCLSQPSDFLKWIDRAKPWKRMRLDMIRSDVPPELAALIERCLEPDPDKRPKDVAEFRKVFDPILNDLQVGRDAQKRMNGVRTAMKQIISEAAGEAGTFTPSANANTFQTDIRRRLNSRSLQFPSGCVLPLQCRRANEYNTRLQWVADELNRLLDQVDSVLRLHTGSETALKVAFDAVVLEIQRLLPQFLALEHLLADCLGEAML